ncbi:N-acetylmuramoyl-L-alanine amidase [Paraclostridium bifermentans]|uniref:N-acetylmuramoyl-L-alanine amidase n=1 Tax=Paraclostridium bifermentans TaxID=1490 RepID=UPI00359C9676
MSKRKNVVKRILTASLVCALTILSNGVVASASEPLENELKTVIQSYGQQEVTVEDGISLHLGETIDFSQHPNWKLSNDNVVSINEKGEVKAIGSGTVFLSQQIGDKVHIIEVYVPGAPKYYSFYKADDSRSRDYYKVFVDAGHGGYDSGAPGIGGKNEDDVNLEVAKRVEQKLQAKNIEVKMSRTDDTFISLSGRADMANNYGADAYVSVHQNSADGVAATGIETYYHENKEMYKPLASNIQTNAINNTGARDRGVKPANLAVLRESNMPSALFECGFISTQSDYNNLVNPAYQDKLATSIADGVEKYLKDNIKLDGQDYPVINTGKVINTDTLNVRSGYGTSYPKIGVLNGGDKVEIVESQNGWHKIKYNGGYGYVSGRYIAIDEKVPVFSDISGHWAEQQILDFVDKGYINGYGDGTFKPDNQITRAEFVKVVNKVFGFTNVSGENFTDVNPEDWYYNDVCIGINKGYINGYGDDTFRPNAPITREEAAKIISTVLNTKGDGNLTFVDSNEISDWAKPHVDALSDNGIINGYGDGTFRPINNVTRAESVKMLSEAK